MEKENNEKNLKNERKSEKIDTKTDKKKAQKDTKELVVKKEKKDKTGAGKIFRKTSLTVLLILVIITACIGLNIFAEASNWESFDFTEDKIHSLSDMSRQMIQDIENENMK